MKDITTHKSSPKKEGLQADEGVNVGQEASASLDVTRQKLHDGLKNAASKQTEMQRYLALRTPLKTFDASSQRRKEEVKEAGRKLLKETGYQDESQKSDSEDG